MKVLEAINSVDKMKPNKYLKQDKVGWLSSLDARVKTKIIDTHQGGESIVFSGYKGSEDDERELLVPAPYDEMYLRWLEAMIDYHNGEEDGYNNAITLFDNAYEDYKKHYTRTHMPISRGERFTF